MYRASSHKSLSTSDASFGLTTTGREGCARSQSSRRPTMVFSAVGRSTKSVVLLASAGPIIFPSNVVKRTDGQVNVVFTSRKYFSKRVIFRRPLPPVHLFRSINHSVYFTGSENSNVSVL